MKIVGSIVLYILSQFYGLITRQRNRLYDAGILKSYRSTLPVISVGNLTAGGNAKTPLCAFIARALKDKGRRPVVLSRGYGGKTRGPYLVLPDDSHLKVGDEPCMLARSDLGISVVVARDRVAGCKFIEEHNLGDLVILDDGFQHRRLSRDIDLVSVNVSSPEAIDGFIDGILLPMGRFREERDPALLRADIIVFSERKLGNTYQEIDPKLLKLMPQSLSLYRSYIENAEIRSLKTGERVELKEASLFCGIANPDGFFRTVKELGVKAVNQRSFSDHHKFSAGDIESLLTESDSLPLLCTEKDAIKIPEELAERVHYLQISTRVEPVDAFIVELMKRLLEVSDRLSQLHPRTEADKVSQKSRPS